MKQFRSVGGFMLACSILCFIIAFETYYSDVRTAKQFTEMIEGVDFESVPIRMTSIASGLAGVVLVVAGGRLLLESRVTRKEEFLGNSEDT